MRASSTTDDFKCKHAVVESILTEMSYLRDEDDEDEDVDDPDTDPVVVVLVVLPPNAGVELTGRVLPSPAPLLPAPVVVVAGRCEVERPYDGM